MLCLALVRLLAGRMLPLGITPPRTSDFARHIEDTRYYMHPISYSDPVRMKNALYVTFSGYVAEVFKIVALQYSYASKDLTLRKVLLELFYWTLRPGARLLVSDHAFVVLHTTLFC